MCRSLFVSLALVYPMFGWNGGSRAADDCKAILAKAIQAHGGAEKLSKIHAIQTTSQGDDPYKVDGITVPKKMGVNRDGKEVREVEYTEIKLLPAMDVKEFDNPSSK